MTSLLQLDNIQDCIGGATSEQITKLFPKCRPRDINLNPLSNQQPLPPASPAQQQDDIHDHDNNSLSLASRHKLSVVSVVMDAPPSADRCKVGCSSVVGGEEEEADEPEEGTENCCQHGSNVGNNTDNSSDLDNSDDMLQDDDEDIVIDHTSATNQNNQSQQQQQQSQAEQHDNEVIVLTSGNSNGKVGSTYKLRDSRIIEIAGGRELFSQSRSKAARCKAARYEETSADKPNKRGSKTQGVWELRSRCSGEPRSKRMSTASSGTHQQSQPMHMPNTNQREVTETVFSTEVRSVVRHQRGGNTASPLRLGEVVVFDDIGGEEDWHGIQQGTTLSSAGSSPSPPASSGYHRTATDFFKAVTSASDLDGDSLSPEHGSGSVGGGSNKLVGAGPRVIGNLPIAEYEGSPRRYGPRQLDVSQSHPVLPSAQSLLASPSVYPPRPGFPQRVLPTPADAAADLSIPVSTTPSPVTTSSTAFDYLYEFSETRKVLEEFFKCPPASGDNGSASGAAASDFQFQELEYELRRHAASGAGSAYVGQRLAKGATEQQTDQMGGSPRGKMQSTTQQTSELDALQEHDPEGEGHFLDLSADTTGSTEDLGDTEVGGLQVGHSRNFTLSPETTDCDSNCGDLDSEVSLLLLESESGISAPLGLGGPSESGLLAPVPDSSSLRLYSSMPVLEDGLSSGHASDTDNNHPTVAKLMKRQITEIEREISARSSKEPKQQQQQQQQSSSVVVTVDFAQQQGNKDSKSRDNSYDTTDPELEALDPLNASGAQMTPPPPAPQPHRSMSLDPAPSDSVEAAIKDIRLALQRTKTLPLRSPPGGAEPLELTDSPIWVPRRRSGAAAAVSATTNGETESQQRKPHNLEDGDEPDTDLETDRLLGQQRTDDQGFFDEKVEKGEGGSSSNSTSSSKKKGRNKEVMIHEPAVLIEGVLFRARYLGSTQLVCEGQPTKTTRMTQAEEAVSRIKAPEGETQPSTEVDLFISTEKIMVLNTDLKEIMMDHALRTISYIADIGDLVVLMARRRFVPHDVEEAPKINRTPKMICHVFESEEAQFIAQSIGQAFQVAYMEFLKANGIEDHSFVKEMDYQEVLNSQEIFGDELQMFAKKEMQKEVVVPKAKGEILGVVIVESGWGSMLPTVVIANLAPSGAAARCGQLNIGDQIIAINGVSLVGLPLSTCQNYIKNTKTQTVVKLTVVPCAPVVEVKIKRPDTKYQLGFSVQNGVICSLLRGGIAERGGVRVGHRIIEINNQSVVAVPHEKIVNLLATSVGEILMKTMPTSMFRLLTGQETPVYI